MKCVYLLTAIFSILISCSKKQEVLKVDNEIKVIKLNQGKGIIFPASYGKKVFTDSKGFFTPNEKTVRFIDRQFIENYESLLTYYQNDNPHFSMLKKDLQFYDKQFFGLIDEKHDSLVHCAIFNLTKSNPYNMKERILKDNAECSGFWFDENMFIFEYNLKTKKFSTRY